MPWVNELGRCVVWLTRLFRQYLAENSIWIQMVLSLMTMTISKAVDPDTGKIIEPEVAFTSGIVS